MESKFFYTISYIWLCGSPNTIEELYYLLNTEINIHINSINTTETEKLIENCKDENGDEYHLRSLVNCDPNKMRLNTIVKIDTKKMLNMLDDCGYKDSLKYQT